MLGTIFLKHFFKTKNPIGVWYEYVFFRKKKKKKCSFYDLNSRWTITNVKRKKTTTQRPINSPSLLYLFIPFLLLVRCLPLPLKPKLHSLFSNLSSVFLKGTHKADKSRSWPNPFLGFTFTVLEPSIQTSNFYKYQF